MSDALTARQTQILKTLIDEYIETADPVGSENLEKKYSLGVSPATIRSEMCALTKTGFLKQPHTSAGRVPTPKAMKFYIDQLMDERQMSLAEEVRVKEDVMEVKNNIDKILEEATHSLAQTTKSLAIGAVDDDDRLWHSGFANVFTNPEFEDIQATASLFSFLEEVQRMHELFFQRMTGASPVEVIFGEELGWPGFSPIGVVGTRFNLLGKNCALGVIGPARLPYSRVIPVIRYFRGIFETI
jgi:transcriptional regulator of heat shock response